MIRAVFWDFGGVITTSPFDSFNIYEESKNLPKDLIRTINSTNPDNNAWAKLERSEIDQEEFDSLFEVESQQFGHSVPGKQVLALLKGQIRPEMVKALREIKDKLIQGCLTNNIQSTEGQELETDNAAISGTHQEIMGLFDFVFESSKENVRKPDPRFYQLACKRGKVNPNEVIFLDDLGINLKPAKALGMKTIKVVRAEDALQDLQDLLDFPII
ncbi:MAG: haloacid dehalogenase [Gammaproteobacteria bacterium]|nr:MAG: haloacid dehalogenase [Gammaproteobacteria bacterium]